MSNRWYGNGRVNIPESRYDDLLSALAKAYNITEISEASKTAQVAAVLWAALEARAIFGDNGIIALRFEEMSGSIEPDTHLQVLIPFLEEGTEFFAGFDDGEHVRVTLHDGTLIHTEGEVWFGVEPFLRNVINKLETLPVIDKNASKLMEDVLNSIDDFLASGML